MSTIRRLALLLVVGGALFFGLRDGAGEAINGNPEAIWDANVDRVDRMIDGDTQVTVSGSLETSMAYAEGVTEDVAGLAD